MENATELTHPSLFINKIASNCAGPSASAFILSHTSLEWKCEQERRMQRFEHICNACCLYTHMALVSLIINKSMAYIQKGPDTVGRQIYQIHKLWITKLMETFKYEKLLNTEVELK